MAVRSGFFDAKFDDQTGKYDRTYNAEDFGQIMEGVFTDGILNNVRDGKFEVRLIASTANLTVATGKGWFLNTWIRNEDTLTLTADPNPDSYTRIDTVVIDINKSDNIRENSIQIVKGTSNRPTLANGSEHHQYPLADIYILGGGTTIDHMVDRRDETYATSAIDINSHYPVGSIYITTNNENPATWFGGVWRQISGKFLIGCGGDFAPGSTGGSWTNRIRTENLPAHNHGIDLTSSSSAANITFNRVGVNAGLGGTVMGWARSATDIPDQAESNWIPASWGFRYAYNGANVPDATKITVGAALYETGQVNLVDSTHSHYIQGATGNAGGEMPIDIRPPYLAVYMWERMPNNWQPS